MLEGIDVSSWQGGKIAWPLVASAKAFAIIRAAYGVTPDADFAEDWAGAKAAGLPRGAYDYLLPTLDGAVQAQAFLARVGGDPGELPCIVDVETLSGSTPAGVVLATRAWIETVRSALGRRAMLYGSPGFLDQLPLDMIPSDTLLFVSHYTLVRPSLPSGWATWDLWQYSGSGSCPGVSGHVDMDRFEGSLEELRGLATRPIAA